MDECQDGYQDVYVDVRLDMSFSLFVCHVYATVLSVLYVNVSYIYIDLESILTSHFIYGMDAIKTGDTIYRGM